MQLIEVERKRELLDKESLQRRLAELGYEQTGKLVEIDTYYSRPDVDYLETVECLRVRRRDGFAEITYKPPSTAATHSNADVIAKRETNIVLAGPDHAEAANHLLTAIGMIELVRVEKTRTSYRHPRYDDIIISVDEVAGAGTFVETEVTATDPAAATSYLKAAEIDLGISDYPVVSLPYRDLVMQSPLYSNPGNSSA